MLVKCYRLLVILFTSLLMVRLACAACVVLSSSGTPIAPATDPLAVLLTSESTCPKDVFALRQLLKENGLKLETALVANRGFHNPSMGSFSMFEMVSGQLKLTGAQVKSGDFFIGHFTGINAEGYLVANQEPENEALMIEAFAWDPQKETFNFYELIGNGKQGEWFYRGDSDDIQSDNRLLHRQPDPNHPQFGSRLRCSACHGNGGPIMKELQAPQNDWWEPKRKLDFAGRKPDNALKEIFATLVPAQRLSENVLLGMQKLNESNTFYQRNAARSLQEQLRPLFCPVEVNLMSDFNPNQERKQQIAIPLEFFMDTRFLNKEERQPIVISRTHYEKTLAQFQSHFPETNLTDADHAWLTPVKAQSDKLIIDNLITRGVIDKKFVADVLNVDMTNPVFSTARCKLLRFLPNNYATNWRDTFIQNLSEAKDPAAKQLLENLINPHHTLEFYKQKTRLYLNQCRSKLNKAENVTSLYQLLAQRRAEIRASEISANRLGKILEPGFRVIFPDSKIRSIPGELMLTEECHIIQRPHRN